MKYVLIYFLIGLAIVVIDSIIDYIFANMHKRQLYIKHWTEVLLALLLGMTIWPVYLCWLTYERIQRRKHFGTKFEDMK